ncbi:uncharacterized protein BJ212DRAFT_848659 [Suillus subaureus]|uniref:CDR ABC transporter domain-containing protein n=1 Tax=Suillus subaureus TaxID=48587 RepID=A0A9P7J6V6_9AGAM|nr:uncharacterized protein BJ212DRAFT_848659 [Suillus subaureus]KAG1805652.1 hypothetical protein BJ212DRAFT_848659 [Suillus subaureus]
MGSFIEFTGGYLMDPEAAEGCQHCPYKTADQYMHSKVDIKDSDHWRNLGIVFGFVAFNISTVFWSMRIRTVGVLASLRLEAKSRHVDCDSCIYTAYLLENVLT